VVVCERVPARECVSCRRAIERYVKRALTGPLAASCKMGLESYDQKPEIL
jgi:hypothetical protein